MSAEKAAGKQRRGKPFEPGQSGNPAGKPKGARHKTTILAEKLMADDAEAVVQQVVDKAKAGDMTAARLVLDRIAPPRRSRPVQFKLPALSNPSDLVTALGAILGAVASGDLTPDEGSAVASLIEVNRRALETVDHEARLTALEKQRDRPREY